MKARDNPFGSSRVLTAIRYATPEGGAGAASLLPRLAALGYCAAIVGPHGSGKTTLLEDIEVGLAVRGFRVRHVRLDTEQHRLPADWPWIARGLGPNDVVCLDGAEQLGAMAWAGLRWRARRAGGLVITANRDGRLPTLVTCTTTPALLDGIIRTLTPLAVEGVPSAAALFTRHRGNLREALRELSDVYAAAP